MKPKVMMVMIGALESGRTTLTRKRGCPAPSIRAASPQVIGDLDEKLTQQKDIEYRGEEGNGQRGPIVEPGAGRPE